MLRHLMQKEEKLVIGLMSGTSGDGIDAALCRIRGCGLSTRLEQLAFVSPSYSPEVQKRILAVAEGNFGGAKELCLLNEYLSQLFIDACFELCRTAGIRPEDIDLIGSHGQTVYHIPISEEYLGRSIRSTLQIGDVSSLAEAFGCIVVSDFRTRDMSAGGLGAPLVPYTEFILYRDKDHTIGLQNIGGIGNITLIPKNASLEDVTAFDTGPGNMIMDAVVTRMTGGRLSYDKDGLLAAQASPSPVLLEELMKEPYLKLPPPKTTGREYFGAPYTERVMARGRELQLTDHETLSTVTMFTAASIAKGIQSFCSPRPERLIVGGGGSFNPTLLDYLRNCLGETKVLTNEDIGYSSAAKEAVAFALLANETVCGVCNNAPSATGARHGVIMGKITQ